MHIDMSLTSFVFFLLKTYLFTFRCKQQLKCIVLIIFVSVKYVHFMSLYRKIKIILLKRRFREIKYLKGTQTFLAVSITKRSLYSKSNLHFPDLN